MNAVVGRRLLAEFTGTGLLVAVVVGSGIAASRFLRLRCGMKHVRRGRIRQGSKIGRAATQNCNSAL